MTRAKLAAVLKKAAYAVERGNLVHHDVVGISTRGGFTSLVVEVEIEPTSGALDAAADYWDAYADHVP